MKRQRLTTITIPIYNTEEDLLNWIEESRQTKADFIKSVLYQAMQPAPTPLTAVELSKILDQKLSNLSITPTNTGQPDIANDELLAFEDTLAGLF